MSEVQEQEELPEELKNSLYFSEETLRAYLKLPMQTKFIRFSDVSQLGQVVLTGLLAKNKNLITVEQYEEVQKLCAEFVSKVGDSEEQYEAFVKQFQKTIDLILPGKKKADTERRKMN
jgi:hypothetical protein